MDRSSDLFSPLSGWLRRSFPGLGSKVPRGGSQTVAGVPLYRLPFEIYCHIAGLLPCAGIHRLEMWCSRKGKQPKIDQAEGSLSIRTDNELLCSFSPKTKTKKKPKLECVKTSCEMNLCLQIVATKKKKKCNIKTASVLGLIYKVSLSQAADFLISVRKPQKHFSTFVPCRMLNSLSAGLKCEQIQHNVLHKGLLRGSPGKPHRTLLIFSPLRWPAHSTRLLWWGYSPGTPPSPPPPPGSFPTYTLTHNTDTGNPDRAPGCCISERLRKK